MTEQNTPIVPVNSDFPQTWNRYSYVGNTPLNAIDPLGLCHAVPGQNMVTDDQPGDCVQNGNSSMNASAGPGGSGGWGALSGGFSFAPCIVENNLGTGLSGRINGSAATSDGPYDPGPAPDGCGYDRGAGGLSQAGPFVPGANTIGPNPTPPPTTVKPGLLDCASALAGKWSIAGALHAMGVGNNGGAGEAITNALGGNAVSGIVDSVRSFSMSPADLLLGGTHMGLGGKGLEQKGLGGAVTDGILGRFWSAVTGAGQSIQTLNGATSLASTSTTVLDFIDVAGWVKVAYDVSSYGAGLLACAAGH